MIASPRRWPRRCSHSSVARPCSGSTTSRRPRTPSRWRLLRCAAMDPDDRDDEIDDIDDEDGHRNTEVTIEVTGLSLYTHHRVTAAEREVGQRLVLDPSPCAGSGQAPVAALAGDTGARRAA